MPTTRLVTGLLIAITALLAVLVLGLGIGGFLIMEDLPQIMRFAREMRQDLQAMRTTTRELVGEIRGMRDTMQALDRRMETMVSEIQGMRATMQTLVGEIRGMRKTMQALSQDMDRMASQMRQLITEIRQMQATMRTLVREIRQMQESLQRLDEMQATMDTMLKELQAMQQVAEEASEQLARRQKALETQLGRRAALTQAQTALISQRRQAVPEDPSWNPLAKLDVVIQLNKIMADELLVMLRHMADSQEDLAEILRPLPVQQKLLGPTPTPPAAREQFTNPLASPSLPATKSP